MFVAGGGGGGVDALLRFDKQHSRPCQIDLLRDRVASGNPMSPTLLQPVLVSQLILLANPIMQRHVHSFC